MFGVINFSQVKTEKHSLIVYSDLPEAISYFFQINKGDDYHIEPNLNKSKALLLSQNPRIDINDLDNYYLPETNILNVGIKQGTLSSVLLSLTENLLNSFSLYYQIYRVIHNRKECSMCDSRFLVSNREKGFSGSVYNPEYFKIIPIDCMNYGSDAKIESKLKKLDFDTSKSFFVTIHGPYVGLFLAKFPLPKNLSYNGIICWKCMKEMNSRFSHIWSH